MKNMKTTSRPLITVAFAILLLCGSSYSQRPSDPALLVPQVAPLLDYVPVANPLALPAGVTIGSTANVAFDSKGHLFVLTRGTSPLLEFDGGGKFIRAFGEGLFTRTHGLRIDSQGNIWVTDVGAHVVVKLDPQGKVILTLGTKGEPGDWNEATQSHRFTEPTDVIINRAGEIFIAQGHTAAGGDPRVFKFDKNAKFVKSWGGKGRAPGQFQVAHGLALDAQQLLWVTDRENQRIQVFDADGKFIREMKYAGLPCGLQIGTRNIYLVNGFAGQILKLNLNGDVLAAVGKPGTGPGEFGEAHFIAVSPNDEIYVADVVNGLKKFVMR
jgi:DNA-binding beta-propeller fold protein YncE